MNTTKILRTCALVGALAVASTAPSQAAEGRNAAFAAGVAVGVLGGAAIAGAPAYGYPAYGYPAYGYPAYAYPAPGYYPGPRYVRPYRHYRYHDDD